MFTILRKYMKVFFWILAITIIPSFVLWGVYGVIRESGSKNQIAGEVYGRKVSRQEYYNAYRACWIETYLMYGDRLREMEKFLNFNTQAWERILLLEEVKRNGITVSDEELKSRIVSIFQRGGYFNKRYYHQVLRRLGINEVAFEKWLRESLATERLRKMIGDAGKVSHKEIELAFINENTTVSLDYVLVTTKEMTESVDVSEEEGKEYFKEHKENFSPPEQCKAKYIFVDAETYADAVEISQQEIARYYEDNKKDYEQRIAAAAHKEGDEETSSGPETGTEEEQDDSMQATKELLGKVTGNIAGVKDKLTSILARSGDDEPPELDLPEDVEEEIRNLLEKEKSQILAEKKAEDMYFKIENELYMETTASQEGFEVKETAPFSKRDTLEELGQDSREFARVAFTTSLFETGDLLKTSRGFYIISPIDRISPPSPAYEEVEEKVLEIVKEKKADIGAQEKASELLEKIKAELDKGDTTLRDVCNALLVDLKNSRFFSRQNPPVEFGHAPELLKEAFLINRGELSQVIKVPDGYLFFGLGAETVPTPAELKKGDPVLEQRLLESKKTAHYQAWFHALIERADLKDYTVLWQEEEG